ncbi:MAG TPA: HYR domain-containing protein, partial [Nitrosopumilaceae archaeon]|nr:HYR domain-containing protein [Nitrosopumilaceae archaeon]
MTKGDKENSRKFGSILLSVILLLSISTVFSSSAFAQTAPVITLNAEEFVPGQTAEITGNEFLSDHEYAIFVIRSDGWVLKNDGSDGFDFVTSDSVGGFYYEYPIQSVAGQYTIFAIDPSDPIGNSIGNTSFYVNAPKISTDKLDYSPDETVKISGTDFTSGASYDIVILRPDDQIIKGDGLFTAGFDSVVSLDGTLSYDYILNGIDGEYDVRIYESSDTEHLDVIAKTGFYDPTSVDSFGSAASNAPSGDWSLPANFLDSAINCSSTPTKNKKIIIEGFDFSGFSEIETNGSNIVGIEVKVDSAHVISTEPLGVEIKKGTTSVGSTVLFNPTGDSCSTSILETALGGSSSLFSTTWTKAELSTIKIEINSLNYANANSRFVDQVKIIVHTADVTDTTGPVITPPSNISIEGNVLGGVAWDDAAVTAFLAGASALDAVEGATTVTNDALVAGVYPVGVHTIYFDSSDSVPNAGTQVSATITVTDTTDPFFDSIHDLIAYQTGGIVNYPLPTASDIVDADVDVVCDPAPGDPIPFGDTTVNCTATDDSGNDVTGSFVITVAPQSLFSSGGFETEGIESIRLIYTNDPEDISAYRLTASNPGQQFLSLFVIG